MPSELNLSPLYYHRLDETGGVLECDVLWPIVHYERTPTGGSDFRIRPLFRTVSEPEPQTVEHQFLWPLGRSYRDPDEANSRLFPVWSWRRHVDENGKSDTDWYLLFPFIWGGDHADDSEDYFGVFPLYVDIPQFLTYDRFRAVLFPLYVRLDKEGHRHHLALWPLIGWSSCAENDHSWFRILPLFGWDIEPGVHERHFALWPVFAWSGENLDGEHPSRAYAAWPLVAWRTGPGTSGLLVLWPVFETGQQEGQFYKLSLFWPFFRYYESQLPTESNVVQWWFWPVIGRAKADDQDSWSVLWPLIWVRHFEDPDEVVSQQFVVPFFGHVHTARENGEREDYVRFWPLWHREVLRDVDGKPIRGDWSVLSALPWRHNNLSGYVENYGFLWQLVFGWQRGPDDDSFDVAARLYTERTRGSRKQLSVPFLFNYESGDEGGTLRLFQFLPIPFFGGGGSQ